MSTRCNVVIHNGYQKVILYRHSDGYPECTGEDLKQFVLGYRNKTLRADPMQSAGWLIIRGNAEYNEGKVRSEPNNTDRFSGWKVGAYEPTDDIHGDVEYIYEIDLDKFELRFRKGSTIKSRVIKKISFAPKENEE